MNDTTMPTPIVRRLQDLPWEHWPADQVSERGKIMWKTLLDDAPQGANMVMGVARLRQGETLEPHRHAEPETYFALSGRGIVTVEGTEHAIEAGTMIFIPGNARHQIVNAGDEDLQILYAFAAKDFQRIVYRF
jgi:quercetin dioxygenase-like cupin family protein